ncbi:MAG TPA: hemolysin family protein [Fimbriimonadaceae bacterium]|nr:hemolysin family protein [Fimbriimonadaceae bacterium]HRJ96853.1 hemolysin family protein [Fimbriimonadaceae bacterium]
MDPVTALVVSAALIVGNGLFVAAEYAFVSARRTRIESLGKRGNRPARLMQGVYKDFPSYVAGWQIAITMLGIGIGAFTEPWVAERLQDLIGTALPTVVSRALSLIFVTFVLVIVGELIPKYLALAAPEKWGLALVGPLVVVVKVLKPLVWLVGKSGQLILKPFGIDTAKGGDGDITKEELAMMLRASSAELFDEEHAQVVTKALRLDRLDASDIMIHRLDIKWIDVDTPRDSLLEKLGELNHSRVPACRGDIDEVAGIVYLQDVARKYHEQDFALESILRPVEVIPENLTLSRAVNRMREAHTQILIVVDEYGGTSGLITLEDIIEEVFGELEDQTESQRPPIERISPSKLTARADVRYDELLQFLGIEADEEADTVTLATMLVNGLGRVPKLGDTIEVPIGKLRVENMARRRITRVWVQLSREKGSP